jgi:hypothetical protein
MTDVISKRAIVPPEVSARWQPLVRRPRAYAAAVFGLLCVSSSGLLVIAHFVLRFGSPAWTLSAAGVSLLAGIALGLRALHLLRHEPALPGVPRKSIGSGPVIY